MTNNLIMNAADIPTSCKSHFTVKQILYETV